jgi:hypothetical protein
MREPGRVDRRTFIRDVTMAGLVAAFPGSLLAEPRGRAPVRVRGRVRSGGRGVARAVVSDGLTSTATRADGTFELVSEGARRWLSLSLPSGHRVPTSRTGTALLHRPIPVGDAEMSALFDLEPLPGGDEAHAFLLLADPQTQTAWEMDRLHSETVPDVRATLGSLGVPAFGVSCGDIMFDELALYPGYERAVAAMGIPFFQVVGNHDLDLDAATDPASTETFQRYFGPTRYSFDRGAVHYVVLDDVFWHGQGYIGYVDRESLEWLASDLAHVEEGRTVVVFLHIPVLPTQHLRTGQSAPGLSVSVANRAALYRILEPYTAHVLSGHTHESEHHRHGGLHEHVNGAVCGAWWSGDICHDGTPNGYGVYEVRGEEIRWRYKATGHGADHQLRVYPAGTDPTAPNEIVANVWFADEDWSVVWYEGGARRGAMARRVGLDPLTVALHEGPELPPHRPWVEPMPTGHLYFAPAPARERAVVVEATDPFGRVFTASPATLQEAIG